VASGGPDEPITLNVRNDSWPFRRSDAFFVVAVVMLALADPGKAWSLGIPSTAVKFGIVIAVVSAWIRFRVFGDTERGPR
jgi:hypothetical protein